MPYEAVNETLDTIAETATGGPEGTVKSEDGLDTSSSVVTADVALGKIDSGAGLAVTVTGRAA